VSFAMTVDDEIREQLLNALKVLMPYARSQGQFHDLNDLRTAIRLALHYLNRAELLANHRLPPRR
jgi:hypothetical protein